MKYLFALLLSLPLVNCRSSYTGLYYDKCVIYHQTATILKLNRDNTFSYEFAYNKTITYGSWISSNDTIILSSEAFKPPTNDLLPRQKYTSYSSHNDIFLYKKGRLIPVWPKISKGNNCFFYRVKKMQ